jgi:XTP/dITP diphosphohydrolase
MSEPILVATRSRGKQVEFGDLLAPLGREIVFRDDVGIPATPEEDAIEAFATFRENAAAKARWFRDRSGLDALADDSGLEVDALDGAPGVHSKRFAGAGGSDHEVAGRNIAELLQRLRGLPATARGARFRCVLVLAQADVGEPERVAEGAVEGRILEAPAGDGGFGYDPVFWCDELQATFGQASREAKAGVSHRARAVASLCEALSG